MVSRGKKAQEPVAAKESGNWKPGNWRVEKRLRFTRKVNRVCLAECEEFLGPHDGRVLAAQLRGAMLDQQSAAALAALNVPTIGNPQCLGR